MYTETVELPARTTLDQAIVALLRLRRRDVPGDATFEQAATLQFGYAQLAAPSRTGESAATGSPEDTACTAADADAGCSSRPMTSPMR